MPMTKRCPKCGETKEPGGFSRDRSRKDSLACWCKMCSNAGNAFWRKANLDRARATSVAWKAANPERAQANTAAWQAANPERVKANGAAWRKANHERKKASNAAWRAANPERSAASNRRARRRHPDRAAARSLISSSVATGRLPRAAELVCTHCGEPAEEYHHHLGYQCPSEVEPVCRPCHQEITSQERRVAS